MYAQQSDRLKQTLFAALALALFLKTREGRKIAGSLWGKSGNILKRW